MGSSVLLVGGADSSTSRTLNRAAQMRHHSQSPALTSQPQQSATTSKQTHGASSVPRGDATTGPARPRASHAHREGRSTGMESGPGTPLEPWGCCSLSLLSSCFSSAAGTCSSYKPRGQPQRKRHLALLSRVAPGSNLSPVTDSGSLVTKTSPDACIPLGSSDTSMAAQV